MRKLEDFVFEKLKVTKNNGVGIMTTVRKFIAWFIGEEEFRINRFDLEDRNFISSDESMSKGDIIDFLYKHINDKIYVDEEEKRARDECGGALYNYSFDIEGITFSIDARIYNDSELLSHSKDYIIEKLKVSKNNFNTLQIELRNFITWYMFDNKYWTASDLKSVKFAEGTVNKYFDYSYRKLYDFINKHSKDVIYVSEEKINNTQRYVYSFTIDDIPFNLEASIEDDSELLSNQSRILIEKLKVSKNSIGGNIKSTMKVFFQWYFGGSAVDDSFWDNLYTTNFNNDVIKQYFNNDMSKFVDWFIQHMDDTIYVDEVNVDKENYEYTFSCDGIEFVINAWLSLKHEVKPFSKSQYVIRNLQEKLKVTNNPIKGDIKSTMKEFFLWYCEYDETDNDDFWEAMSTIEFENDVIEENFNNMNEFLVWFETHMNDIVYFDEVKIDKETYKYTFSCDGIEFVIDAWLSMEQTPFSKS